MRHDIPYAAAGQVIGLLGGSFDPAHAGHAHITREALKRFGLDQVGGWSAPAIRSKRMDPHRWMRGWTKRAALLIIRVCM